MLKKIMLFCLLFLFVSNFLDVCLLFADRIGDMRDKIEEEKERQEKEKEKPDDDDEDDDGDDDDSSCAGLSGCLGIFAIFSLFEDSSGCAPASGESSGCLVGLFGALRFADYPYDPGNPFHFVGSHAQSPDNEKFVYLQTDLEGAYLFEETGGFNAKIAINLSFLRLQCFYQYVFEPDDQFNILSGNIGFTIPIADGMLHIFAGFYLMDIISEMTFSFGGEFTYFFPANLIVDVYSLNSFYGELGFHTFSCTISYALRNISIGGGFNYNYYAGVPFMGPMLKLTLWI